VVQPLHRKHIITPTRCNPMMTQPPGDWSVFKQIFADHWDEFQRAHPRYQTSYYDGLVTKMLACGNPEKMGYVAYRCLHCGQGKHLVSMSCKSSLCLRCAKVSVDNWVSQVSKMLHEGVIYRHIILTVPAMFIYSNQHVLIYLKRLEPERGAGDPLYTSPVLCDHIIQIFRLTDDNTGAVCLVVTLDSDSIRVTAINGDLQKP
jgi:hypothetical protein